MKKKTTKVSSKNVLKDSVLALQCHMLEAFARLPQSQETQAIIASLNSEKEKLSK